MNFSLLIGICLIWSTEFKHVILKLINITQYLLQTNRCYCDYNDLMRCNKEVPIQQRTYLSLAWASQSASRLSINVPWRTYDTHRTIQILRQREPWLGWPWLNHCWWQIPQPQRSRSICDVVWSAEYQQIPPQLPLPHRCTFVVRHKKIGPTARFFYACLFTTMFLCIWT